MTDWRRGARGNWGDLGVPERSRRDSCELRGRVGLDNIAQLHCPIIQGHI